MLLAPDMLTGTVIIVSASSSALPCLDLMWRTRLPGKWPPAFMAVMPGRIGVVGVVRRTLMFMGSGRLSQTASSDER